MTRKLSIICYPLAAIALAGSLYAAGSTALGYSTTAGYNLTGKAADKWGAHGVTPTVQQTGVNQTAFKVLQTKGVIDPTAAEYSVQHRTVAVSAANLIAMYTTPVQLLAAPGAGKQIVVSKLIFTITRTSTAFTGGGAAIVQYGNTANGAGTQALDSTIAATVITGSAATTATIRNGAVISDSTAPINAGLFISNATGVFAAGTGTASVEIWYFVVGGV